MKPLDSSRLYAFATDIRLCANDLGRNQDGDIASLLAGMAERVIDIGDRLFQIARDLEADAGWMLRDELRRSKAEAAASRKPPTVQWVPDPETET